VHGLDRRYPTLSLFDDSDSLVCHCGRTTRWSQGDGYDRPGHACERGRAATSGTTCWSTSFDGDVPHGTGQAPGDAIPELQFDYRLAIESSVVLDELGPGSAAVDDHIDFSTTDD
jgi:hypothetical protein